MIPVVSHAKYDMGAKLWADAAGDSHVTVFTVPRLKKKQPEKGRESAVPR